LQRYLQVGDLGPDTFLIALLYSLSVPCCDIGSKVHIVKVKLMWCFVRLLLRVGILGGLTASFLKLGAQGGERIGAGSCTTLKESQQTNVALETGRDRVSYSLFV
jgi:hypothetical protein